MAAGKHLSRLGGPTLAVDLLCDIAGGFLFAVALQCFCAPNNIAPGGASGVAVLVNYATKLPISLVSFAINIPLMILAYLFLGRVFALRSIKSICVLTVMLQLCAFLPAYRGEVLLAALYGGLLQGVGLSIIFLRASCTGGTDIVSRLVQLKFPAVPVGKLMLLVDAMVLLAAALVYRSIESGLVALITIFCSTRMIDTILYGADRGKLMMIFTSRHQEMAAQILAQLARGCSILYGKGAYTDSERPALICAVRSGQLYELKELVRSIDRDAFLVALEASEIVGEGFKDPDLKR